MKYYSLKQESPPVGFREAAIHGQAPDGGLYFPEHIPVFDSSFFHNLENMPDEEIAYQVMQPYVDDMNEEELRKVIRDTLSFPLPLVRLNEDIFSLELFHGPTLAFKDVGARFMSRCLAHFVRGRQQKLVVLVATSGDTGGAVAHGFYGVKGVEVVILYPSGKVSRIQEQQLTTLGGNIRTLEVDGSFDHCQQLVKQAFSDYEINQKIFLTSANSINVARWLPQQIYYFLALKQWPFKQHPPVISVPSGNFGNICAAAVAHASGLPVQHLVAACNANDVVPEFLRTGEYLPKPTVATISNAMDVGSPNNFVRLLEVFDEDIDELQRIMSAVRIDDDETREVIKRVYRDFHYILDPHGAVGFLALERYLQEHAGLKGFFVETAHPAKFPDVVEPVIAHKIPLPAGVEALAGKFKVATKMGVDFSFLKNYLLNK
jgi:threonine synthase